MPFRNRTIDAGLMKITDPGDFPSVEMGLSDLLKDGQWCLATGHPGGYQADRKPVLRLGRVLLSDNNTITTDCTLVGGDSGGPALDSQGRVIGVASRGGESNGQCIQSMYERVDSYKDFITTNTITAANNAGIALRSAFLAPDALVSARAELETNYFGPLAVSRAFAPILARNGGGAIVNVLSAIITANQAEGRGLGTLSDVAVDAGMGECRRFHGERWGSRVPVPEHGPVLEVASDRVAAFVPEDRAGV